MTTYRQFIAERYAINEGEDSTVHDHDIVLTDAEGRMKDHIAHAKKHGVHLHVDSSSGFQGHGYGRSYNTTATGTHKNMVRWASDKNSVVHKYGEHHPNAYVAHGGGPVTKEKIERYVRDFRQ
jgi:hypothetical protein